MPRGPELGARLGSVLEVVYLIFNEGYAATAGEDLVRPALCAEAQRLGRVLAGLMPEEPEVWGLLALMELQASRLAARIGPDGAAVPLPEQNRARWDRLLIGRGLAALARAEALGGAGGPYALQAAIAACHARARRAEETDWRRIAGLYDALAVALPSPVVALNRAVAHEHGRRAGGGAGALGRDRGGGARRATRRCRRRGATSCSGPGGGPRRGRRSRRRRAADAQRRGAGVPAAGGPRRCG